MHARTCSGGVGCGAGIECGDGGLCVCSHRRCGTGPVQELHELQQEVFARRREAERHRHDEERIAMSWQPDLDRDQDGVACEKK